MLELVTGTEVRRRYSIIGIKPLMFCNDGKPQRKDWTPFVSRAGLRGTDIRYTWIAWIIVTSRRREERGRQLTFNNLKMDKLVRVFIKKQFQPTPCPFPL